MYAFLLNRSKAAIISRQFKVSTTYKWREFIIEEQFNLKAINYLFYVSKEKGFDLSSILGKVGKKTLCSIKQNYMEIDNLWYYFYSFN